MASLEQSKVDETYFPGGAARRRKELKFSWDDRVKHEDWGIQKVEHAQLLMHDDLTIEKVKHDSFTNHCIFMLMMFYSIIVRAGED